MCGIFGLLTDSDTDPSFVKTNMETLFKLSESRGKEAAGLALQSKDKIHILKAPLSASKLIRSESYQKLMKKTFEAPTPQGPFTLIGHSRLVTNGLQTLHDNNQPVESPGLVAVHNGIVVNDRELWAKHPSLERKSEVDSEIILKLTDWHMEQTGDVETALQKTFSEIEGSASIAGFLKDSQTLVVATNTGSIYFAAVDKTFVFASEKFILKSLFAKQKTPFWQESDIQHLKPGRGLSLDIKSLKLKEFSLQATKEGKGQEEVRPATKSLQVVDHSLINKKLRRCSKCILPETFPHIRFAQDGVCNYCQEYRSIQTKGREALEKIIAPYRKKSGEPDVIVAFSGGRDSSYGLHYVKKELGMNPIAYTYDWGMVTDLARRNQARICGKLGIEHIIVSAAIGQKRKNIRKNVEAWLKRPELGMIPLFMAGDKQFFHYARQLRKQTGIKLVIFCAGNDLETTGFKSGFTGVKENYHQGIMTKLSKWNKFRILFYYAKQYLLNPAYINSSIWDTFFAFYSVYFKFDDFVYLYKYIPWDEEKIEQTLQKEYGWELAKDTESTWRIGDGTAAFYNYIYHNLAGFSEHDTFRSNQIREGIITREQAMQWIEKDNSPRWDSMKEYAQQVGFNFEEAINIINGSPKLYQ